MPVVMTVNELESFLAAEFPQVFNAGSGLAIEAVWDGGCRVRQSCKKLGQISEKAQAQQSAGVDAARARKVDRSRHAPKADEADKEAIRKLAEKHPIDARNDVPWK